MTSHVPPNDTARSLLAVRRATDGQGPAPVPPGKQIVTAMLELGHLEGFDRAPAQRGDTLVLSLVSSADATSVFAAARAKSPSFRALVGPERDPRLFNTYVFRPRSLSAQVLSTDSEQRARHVSALLQEKLGIGEHLSTTSDPRFANVSVEKSNGQDWTVHLNRSSPRVMWAQSLGSAKPFPAMTLASYLKQHGVNGVSEVAPGVVEVHGVRVAVTPLEPHADNFDSGDPQARGSARVDRFLTRLFEG